MRGGKRPGAGRPVAEHTIQAQAFKRRLIERVLEEADPIIDKLISNAKRGEIQAIKEITDRVLGRPLQQTELSGKDGGAIQVQGVEITVRSPEAQGVAQAVGAIGF